MAESKIDLLGFRLALEPLIENLEEDSRVYHDPVDAFESWFEDGFTVDQHWDWFEEAVIIWIGVCPSWKFDLQTGRWTETHPGEKDLRIFRITSDGIMGEILPDSVSTSEEWFKVSDPYEAFAFIKFLFDLSEMNLRGSKFKEISVKSLIEDVYAPLNVMYYFGAYDDQIVNGESWVSTKGIRSIIKEFIKSNREWMPFLKTSESIKSQQDIKSENKADKKSAGRLFGDANVESHSDLIKTLHENNLLGSAIWDDDFIDFRSDDFDKDTLLRHKKWRSLDTAIVYAKSPQGGYHYKLPLKLKIKDSFFAPYFGSDVNPGFNSAITDLGTYPFIKDDKQIDGKISIPSYINQVRITFELLSYRHKIKRLSEELLSFKNQRLLEQDQSKHFRRTVARYHSVKKVVEALPSDDLEFARLTQPLPFFLEIPLTHWERAAIGNRYFAASALLQQTLKITCLLILEELHAVRSDIEFFAPFPKGLIEALAGKPSLGHWWRCIEHIVKYKSYFTVWSSWIDGVFSEKDRIIRLIEIRNRNSHPEYIFDPKLIKRAENQFDDLFLNLVPKIRSSCSDVQMILPRSRKGHRDNDGKLFYGFDCLNIKTGTLPLPEILYSCSNENSTLITEDEMLCVKGKSVVPLSSFFKFQLMEDDTPEIFIYDKEYRDSTARMIGVLSEITSKVDVPEGIFTFG